MKAIQTEYKGYRFRSRLEARWAVFFDACGVAWEYEPEGYDLGNGLYYLPDFLLHGVRGRVAGDLYVEVKGTMTECDARKISRFSNMSITDRGTFVENPILVVGNIPEGGNINDILRYIGYAGYKVFPHGVCMFNFITVDGDYFAAYPGVNRKGRFELFGDDASYLRNMNRRATERAYRMARQARFEFGETPRIRRYRRHA